MKKISTIVIISIIFSLCIIPYGFVNAENETETSTGNTTEASQNNNNKTDSDNKEDSSNNNNDKNQGNKETKNNTSSSGSSTSSKSTTQKQTTTQTEKKKSSNANLSDLGIKPNDFSGFKPDTLTYDVTVPNDVEKINVYAKAQDANAQITSGTGNHNLDVGTNDISIIVTAEDGSTQTYTINVTRKADKEEKSGTKASEVKNYDLQKLEIRGYTLNPAFSPDIYEYKLDVKGDVIDLDVITEGLNDNVDIEVAGNKDLKER